MTPIHNAAAYLEEAVASVFAQTTAVSWELLLIDDGSSDGSLEIAAGYAQRHPGQVRLLHHPHHANCGTSATRNLGLRHARGALLALLDADDVWIPTMLASQLALLRRFPAAEMVYANAERTWQMDLPSTPFGEPAGLNELPPLLPAGAEPGLLPPGQPLAWFLDDETLVPCTCTVLMRTQVARAVGGFDESFAGLYDDQAFYAKVMLRGRTAVSLECVARYRRHYTSCCARTWHNIGLQAEARADFESWLGQYRSLLAREAELLQPML